MMPFDALESTLCGCSWRVPSYTVEMEIRIEGPEDIQEIRHLTTDAFASMPFSNGSEPGIIDKLRAAGDLTLSLVAVKDGALAGHVAFSPVKVGSVSNGWYGLGPLSVWPDLQHRGIGSTLINEGLRILRENGADGCALIGDPNYYRRLGFTSDGNVQYEDLPDEYVQWISFNDLNPKGLLVYSPAFSD